MKLLFSPQPARRGIAAAMFACLACLVSIAPARGLTAAEAKPDAKAVLMRMANYLAKLPSFSVDVRDSYDTVQSTGQKIEYAGTRTITVVRPDRLRLEIVESDGNRQTLVINSKDIALTSQPANVFAQTPSPGNLDQAIVHFVRDLGMRVPFAPLLLTTLAAEIEQRTKTLDYVEKTDILGAPAHHLAGRADGVDYQVWISDGDKPLPLRLVLTYVKEKGEPQFRAHFSNWNLAPQVTDAAFVFAPPPGAQRIAFLATLPRGVAPKAATGSKSGSSSNPGTRR